MRRMGVLGYGGCALGAHPPREPHHSPRGAAKCERHHNGGRNRAGWDASGDAKDRVGDARDAIRRPLVAAIANSFSDLYTRTVKGKNASLASPPTRFASSDASPVCPVRPGGGQRSLTGGRQGRPTAPRTTFPLPPQHEPRYTPPMLLQAPAPASCVPGLTVSCSGGAAPFFAGRPDDRPAVVGAGRGRPAAAPGDVCPWCGPLGADGHVATCRSYNAPTWRKEW